VGCTVIELLTGAPPYFDLDPMPALFHIVEDEWCSAPPELNTTRMSSQPSPVGFFLLNQSTASGGCLGSTS